MTEIWGKMGMFYILTLKVIHSYPSFTTDTAEFFFLQVSGMVINNKWNAKAKANTQHESHPGYLPPFPESSKPASQKQ